MPVTRSKNTALDPDMLISPSVITDAEACRQLVNAAIENDKPRSAVRATYKNLHDGGLPYNPAELEAEGQGNRANFPSKQAKAITSENVNAYTDLRTRVTRRAEVKIEVDGASPWQNADWSNIVSEGYNLLLSWWPEEFSMYQKSDFNRVFFSAGPQYYPNADTWQPRAARYGEVLVAENAPTDLMELPYAIIRKAYYPADLYQFIKNESIAEKFGWNVKAVKKAISECGRRHSYDGCRTPEDWERRLKNNGLLANSGNSSTVPTAVVHYKELDGRIKWKMICEWGDVNDYLFQSKTSYANFRDYLNPFFLETSDGDWHAPNGLASQFFSILKAIDLLNCQIADMTCIASSVIIIPSNETDLAKLQSVSLGPVTVLPPGVQATTVNFPNLSQGALAFGNHLTRLLQNTTGAFQSGQVDPTGSNPTATQIQAQIANAARLSGNQQVQFSLQEDQRHFQMVKRALNPNIREDREYGRLAKKFQKYCLDRGVPAKALHPRFLAGVKANLASGAGSNAARMMIADQKLATVGAIQDPTARIKATKEAFAEKFSPEYAERCFLTAPPPEGNQEQANAIKENAFFNLAQPMPAFDSDNAEIHLGIHIPMVMNTWQASQQEGGDLQKAYQVMTIALPHIQRHLAQIVFNPFIKDVAKEFSDQYQELARGYTQVQQQLGDQIEAEQAAQAKAQEEQAALLQEALKEPDPIELAKLRLGYDKQALAREKQAHKVQTDEVNLRLKVGQQRQSMAIADVDTSLKVKESKQPQPQPKK